MSFLYFFLGEELVGMNPGDLFVLESVQLSYSSQFPNFKLSHWGGGFVGPGYNNTSLVTKGL
jgi:hypothetical protein